MSRRRSEISGPKPAPFVVVKIHALRAGLPECRFTTSVPRDWPAGHLWIRWDQLSMVKNDALRCEACAAAVRRRT